MTKNIIIILLLIILAMGIHGSYLTYNITSDTKVVTVIEVDSLTITDTVYIPEPQIIVRDMYAPVRLPGTTINPITNRPDTFAVVLPYHRYQDTIYQDSASFAYNMEVEGYLRHFDYTLTAPITTITNTETITNTKHRTIDIYAIGGFSHNPYIGLDIAYKRHKLGYRRDLPISSIPAVHHIEYGYRFADY